MEALLSPVVIIPIVVGFLLGLLANYIFYKLSKKKITILHDYKGPIDIGSGLTSLFPNVKLRYNGEYINYKIQYITGTFKNTDTINDVITLELPIQLILPQGCVVLEAKLLDPLIKDLEIEHKDNIILFKMPKSFLHQTEIKYCALYKSSNVENSVIKSVSDIPNVSFSDGIKEYRNKLYFGVLCLYISLGILFIVERLKSGYTKYANELDYVEAFVCILIFISMLRIAYIMFIDLEKRKKNNK